jgi:hypothetical protein
MVGDVRAAFSQLTKGLKAGIVRVGDVQTTVAASNTAMECQPFLQGRLCNVFYLLYICIFENITNRPINNNTIVF